MNIVISLPVHENADVVIDQIENIKHFVPDSIIVIHINKQFKGWKGYTVSNFKKFKNVIVNPIRMFTSYSTGILFDIHLSNFNYAKQFENIDYFNLHSSNDMFVSHGVEKYIKEFDVGVFQNKVLDTGFIHGRHAMKDKNFLKILHELEINDIYFSQVEGSFYSYDLFNRITEINDNNTGLNLKDILINNSILQRIPYFNSAYVKVNNWFLFNKPLYAKEEVFFATIASKYGKHFGYPYCYNNWKKNLRLSKGEIDSCISGEVSNNIDVEKASIRKFFAVKRVPRVIDDPIRVYIRSLQK